ncbi:MAG: hypothetical protein NUV82_04260 [Candidatus Komeilibacteria bacterium]|nr:hypothetical protein [Candidatus Komeilibacteria bacterium]
MTFTIILPLIAIFWAIYRFFYRRTKNGREVERRRIKAVDQKKLEKMAPDERKARLQEIKDETKAKKEEQNKILAKKKKRMISLAVAGIMLIVLFIAFTPFMTYFAAEKTWYFIGALMCIAAVALLNSRGDKDRKEGDYGGPISFLFILLMAYFVGLAADDYRDRPVPVVNEEVVLENIHAAYRIRSETEESVIEYRLPDGETIKRLYKEGVWEDELEAFTAYRVIKGKATVTKL